MKKGGKNIFPAVAADSVPFLGVEQMREVDRVVIQDLHIGQVQMMENAGRNLAHLAISLFLDNSPKDKVVTILAGTGGNGGGALSAARHLSNLGAKVQCVLTAGNRKYTRNTGRQLNIIKKLGIPAVEPDAALSVEPSALIIDGLLGYGLLNAPEGVPAILISWMMEQKVPILSLDCPSGLNCDSGKAMPPAVKADATMTLAMPKTGLLKKEARKHTGRLFLGDIGIPPELYEHFGIDPEKARMFDVNGVIEITG